jgi:hypothetical protein
MSTEACNIALKNTINEIKNVCPDVTNILVFRENGEILAGDENTSEVTINSTQETFRALSERATVVGGIESVIFSASESKINISQFDDLYVTTVASDGADERTISNVVRVMIPTTLKIVQNIYPSIKSQSQEVTLKTQPTIHKREITNPEVQANEYTVENLTLIGGFMIDPETAYIDIALIVQWAEKYGNQPIKKISLEAANGKIVQCKFQPLKGEKYENRGIVKISEKIQAGLNVNKGTKVLIRPVFETEEDIEKAKIEKTDKTIKSMEKAKNNKEPIQASKPDMFKGFDEYTRQAPVLQVMVENLGGIGGLLGNPDYVRVDSAVIASWKEMFGEKEIKEVTVEETTFGKKIQCKLQPIKDSQLEGKGVTQIPEKLQQALQIKKGSLVLIKPVVGKSERSRP